MIDPRECKSFVCVLRIEKQSIDFAKSRCRLILKGEAGTN